MHGEASIDPDTHAATGLGSFGIVIAFAIPKIELKTDIYEGEESYEPIHAGIEDMKPIEESEQGSKFSRALSKFGNVVKKAVKGALETEAGVYVELILAGGVTKEGATSSMLVPPCETTTFIASTKFGADVKFLGLSLASPSTTKEIMRRHHIDPAIQRCKDVPKESDGWRRLCRRRGVFISRGSSLSLPSGSYSMICRSKHIRRRRKQGRLICMWSLDSIRYRNPIKTCVSIRHTLRAVSDAEFIMVRPQAFGVNAVASPRAADFPTAILVNSETPEAVEGFLAHCCSFMRLPTCLSSLPNVQTRPLFHLAMLVNQIRASALGACRETIKSAGVVQSFFDYF